MTPTAQETAQKCKIRECKFIGNSPEENREHIFNVHLKKPTFAATRISRPSPSRSTDGKQVEIIDPRKIRIFSKLPNSSKKILLVLFDQGAWTIGNGMDHKGILGKTGVAGRTLRYGLKRLEDEGLIGKIADLKDARRTIFFLALRNKHL